MVTKLQKELNDLETELVDLITKEKSTKARLGEVRKRIVEINKTIPFLPSSAKSEVYGRIRITKSESYPTLNVPKFIEVFGLDVFLQCFTITNGEMNLEKWKSLVKAEVVVESMLAECLDQKETPAPKVTVISSQ